MKPTKKQLAEFDRFWLAEHGTFRCMKRETAEKAKARILDYYTWLWEGAGCPRRFIPKPMTMEPRTFGTGREDRESQLYRFDQDLYPNRKWTF